MLGVSPRNLENSASDIARVSAMTERTIHSANRSENRDTCKNVPDTDRIVHRPGEERIGKVGRVVRDSLIGHRFTPCECLSLSTLL